MIPYLENYPNPRNEYKVYFTGKFEEPKEPEPVKPPTKPADPPKEPTKPAEPPKEPVKTASADKLQLIVNDYGRVARKEPPQLGDVLAMSYKDKVYLVTYDGKEYLII